ncbi:MAG: HIRAN domain-containing protein [Rhodoglobus sp.]
MVKASWQETDQSPDDFRWWDGSAWADAYWPRSRPVERYMPNARRWNISDSLRPQLDIVGENWHEEAIASALGGAPALDKEVEHFVVAELVPEPDNPYDSNALSIRVNGQILGYLSAEDASAFAPPVHRIVESGIVPVVLARIWAVTRRSGLKAAVRVALSSPTMILPENPAPEIPHAVIPVGRSIQVTGEEDHFDVLSRYSKTAGRLLVSLHMTEVQRQRSVVKVLEVRVDGERVGRLTPATSASLEPMYNEADEQGLVVCAWASIKASRLAAELTLRVTRAEDIPETWPSASDQVPQLRPVQQIPKAYINTDPIAPPPEPTGLGSWWILVIVGAVLLSQIPYAGPVLLIAAVVVGVFFELKRRRRPPRESKTSPTWVI